jgi:hypothetical protein
MKNGEFNGIIITVKKTGVSAFLHKQIRTAASKEGCIILESTAVLRNCEYTDMSIFPAMGRVLYSFGTIRFIIGIPQDCIVGCIQ